CVLTRPVGESCRCPLDKGSSLAIFVRLIEIAAQAELPGSFIQGSLRAEEPAIRIRPWIETNDDFGIFHRVILAVVKPIPQRLQQVQRAFIARRIARVADDPERGTM